MRVAGIVIEDHPAIGNLSLDFRDSTGKASKTVILAGENGCGKTAILESIFKALGPPSALTRLEGEKTRATVFIEPDEYMPEIPDQNCVALGDISFDDNWVGFDGFAVRIFHVLTETEASYGDRYIFNMRKKNGLTQWQQAEIVKFFGNGLKCFLSTANTSFDVPNISAATGLVSRPTNYDYSGWMRGGSSLAGEIAQLIVNLRMADDSDTAEWLRTHKDGRPTADVTERRIGPFTRAFSRLFEGKRFVGIERGAAGDLRPVFEQHGRRTPLANLSTGEKQIVFRGAFLLREAEALKSAVVLVDEPELSLHPTWQSKILSFYEAIAQEANDTHNQIFIATHSPFVVHGSPTSKHIILKRDHVGRIYSDPDATYPGASVSEVAIAAFDLQNFTLFRPGNTLALVVEGPTDARILQTAWGKLRPTEEMPFNLLPARNARNIQSLLGNEKNVPGPLADLADSLGITRFIGLFDFDGEGFGHWKGMAKPDISDDTDLDIRGCSRRRRKGCLIWAALLPVPTYRTQYADHDLEDESRLTIELLFPDAQVGPLLSRVGIAGSANDQRLKAKTQREKDAVANGCSTFPPEAFAAFAPIFALVDHVLAFTPPA